VGRQRLRNRLGCQMTHFKWEHIRKKKKKKNNESIQVYKLIFTKYEALSISVLYNLYAGCTTILNNQNNPKIVTDLLIFTLHFQLIQS
jgi:hypothetical protein